MNGLHRVPLTIIATFVAVWWVIRHAIWPWWAWWLR
jgi:hypothetical protein